MTLFAVMREHGPAFDHSRPLEEQELWPEHAQFMDALADEGFIVLGGPLGDGERVLFAVEAESEQAIGARFAADPWVARRPMLVIASIEPWEIRLDSRAR
jgi:uncharacterized protein YciI